MKKIKTLLVFSCLVSFANVYAQPGKDGPGTISAANTIVNEYTYLTADASAGSTSITVNNNGLNANSRFSGVLAQGDLIMIIQMQGVSMNLTTAAPFSLPNDNTWGTITNYNNAGNYEFAQVLSVSGSNTINILCGLKNNYTATGHVQIVRVKRYTTLTVNSSLTGETWNGNTGGLVAVEVQGNTTIAAGGSINVNAIGFRGGVETDNTAYYGAGSWGSSDVGEGAEKGEGIAGFTPEYIPLTARYARGAPANAGGGGNAHNCGGGGGGNAGNLATYTGRGIPNPAYNTIWNLEVPAIGGTSSSGGGRGGNSFSNSNQNANSVSCADPAWGGDYNRNYGGMGGRPLDYSTGRLFFGGGGGAGEQNDGDAGNGGRGAGMVFIMSYGNVSGAGVINANGENGANSVYLAFSSFAAKDGAGGAGAGGTVVINTNGTTSGITINANGGNGGNQNFGGIISSDAYGPGGGGGGGYIAVSAGAPTRNANGGTNGTTNSSGFTEFPPKGATAGGPGLPTETFPHYHFTLADQTICSGQTATLTATITGTVPPGVTLNWYASQFATTSLGTGTTFTTPALATTTTYYVGFCPGHYRLPVTVTVTPGPTVNVAGATICNGSSTTLTATGATTYTWTPATGLSATTGSSVTANPGTTTTYTITGTTGGCTGTTTATVTVTPGPTVNVAGATICSGTSTTLTATGATTYTWTPATGLSATTGASVTANPGMTTTYTITGTTAGCSGTTTATVTVNPSPTVTVPSASNCAGSPAVTLTATGATTYTWTPATGLSATTGASVTANPPSTTTYTITGTTGGCSGTTTATVTINPLPVINSASVVITNETCAGGDGSISGITVSGGTGTLSYEWNGTPSAGPNLSSAAAGPYTLEVTDGVGCSATAGPFTIGNSGGPVINTSSMVITNATCGYSNGSITGITVSGGTGALNLEWNGIVYGVPDMTGADAGSFTLVVTDASGCTSSAGPFTITNSGPITFNTSSMVITNVTCTSLGSITGITASSSAGGLTYEWNGTTTPSADLTSIGPGNFTLVVTDALGCTDSVGAYTVTAAGVPVINTSAINVSSTTCGLVNGSITGITVSGGTGTLTYEWNSSPSAGPSLSGAASGSYTLEVTDASGCSATAGPFTIDPSNTLTALATSTDPTCFGANDGSAAGNVTGGNGTIFYQWIGGPATQNNTALDGGTYSVIVSDSQGCSDTATVTLTEPASINPLISGTTTLCSGSSTTLTASGGTSYSWNTGPTTSSITVSPTTTTTYTVNVTSGGCTETATVTVTVNNAPVASITGGTVACPGQPLVLTANGGGTYVWDDGSTGTNVSVSPMVDTQYYVVASNACGSDTAFVNVTVGTSFTVDAGPDQTIGLGNTATITATGGTSYVWTPSDGLNCTTCPTVLASPTVTTTYTVTATNSSGCTATDEVTIIVDQTISLFVPDIFAPNGNGANDILFVRGSGISSLDFRVYDRWGQKVFQTDNISTGWDGTFNGKPLDTGVFVYTLEGSFVTGESFSEKGNVTLKR